MTLVIAAKANAGTVTSGVAEVLTQRRSYRRNAIADGSGEATIILPGLQGGSLQSFILYESFKIFCDSSAESAITLYEGEVAPQNFLGGSDRGNLNEWEGDPPIYTIEPLIIQWTSADAGSNCYVRIQQQELTLVPVRI